MAQNVEFSRVMLLKVRHTGCSCSTWLSVSNLIVKQIESAPFSAISTPEFADSPWSLPMFFCRSCLSHEMCSK